ncbi:MAG TPA: 23S rRNA (cytidine(2498)-2'-O)-methyltransferase RlmM [Gammaproteobacteria bacterium]|jgi:23S rRNA (cytidine2498-2'-O)-methyltransferase|nr:23S rRNA (cytidine(2498)-2'-O)-methyltransferase RlmM [Gammaproteobacteria bacterium]
MQDTWVLQCRPGFEAECALESGGEAVAEGVVTAPGPGGPLLRRVFARQAFRQVAALEDLPAGDRIDPILRALAAEPGPVHAILMEHPDTEAGKELANFLKRFTPALTSALAKRGLPVFKKAPRRLHLLFTDSSRVRIGFSSGEEGSALSNGILRLKLPREAPSRSTLKLEEALLTFLDAAEQETALRAGMKAVDLGAAPGGWTWQMVQRSIRVTAVDNGPMQPALLDSGLVEHRREDGFRYRPPRPVDWLLCDMVEQPQRIAALTGEWLTRGDCQRALFNLKLPMKKRHESLWACLDGLQERLDGAGLKYSLLCKQLYHDREEVTAYIAMH